jgi:hypothetical protein
VPSRPLVVMLPAVALLAGCSTIEGWFGPSRPAQPQPVAAAAPPPPAPPAQSPINDAPPGLDGHYAGTLRLARGADRSCRPRSIPASATVANGQVAINLGRYGSASASIGGDGSADITGTDLAGQVKFAGTRLSGEVQRSTCPYTVNLTRRT